MKLNRITMFMFQIVLVASSMKVMAVCAGEDAAKNCHGNVAPTALNLDLKAMTVQLSLTDEQVAKIKTLLNDIVTPMAAYRDNMADNNEKLAALNQSNPSDSAAIQALANKQAQIIARVLAMRSQLRSDIEAVLTSEQLAQISKSHDRSKNE